MTQLTSVHFSIIVGGIISPRQDSSEDQHSRNYMPIYRIIDNTINVNTCNIMHMGAFERFDHELGIVRYNFKEFAKYTNMFMSTAFPFAGSWNQGTSSGFDVCLGFVFEDPKDAATFKLACPFETQIRMIDHTAIRI